jgi:TM2 domain-containing membrane protein YozV
MQMAMVFCRGCGKEIHETALNCPHCGAQQRVAANTATRSQSVATMFAAFLGGIGIHRFYLGKTVSGVFYLLFCWTWIPSLISFFEMLVMAFTSQENWANKYNNGQLTEPIHPVVKVVVLILPAIMMIGILAAIAIPAYQGYLMRAHSV